MEASQEAGVLKRSNLGLFQSTVGYKFDGRGTVSLLIIHRSKGIDFVLIAKTKRGGNWILPQGGFDAKSDTKPYDAFLRNGFKQFGLKDEHVLLNNRLIVGMYENEMPPERKAECDKKHVLVIGTKISSSACVKLIDTKKYTETVWVSDMKEFKRYIAENNRSCKFTATCEALSEAKKQGLISWDCEEELGTH